MREQCDSAAIQTLGQSRPAAPDAAIDQLDPEGSGPASRSRSDDVLGPWLAFWLSNRGANRGIPLAEAMQQSLHKSLTQAASFCNNAERKNARAAQLMI